MYLNTEEEYIFDYLSGNLSVADEKMFSSWLDESESRRFLFKQCCKEYYRLRWSNKWNEVSVDNSFLRVQKRLKRERRIRILKYAAFVTMLLTIAGGMVLLKEPAEDSDVVLLADKIPSIDVNKPILTLSTGEQIILSSDVLDQQSLLGVDVSLIDSNSLKYNVKERVEKQSVSYNKLTIPRGSDFYLTLSDGSRVWLNAASELKYPEVFCNGERKVYLSGEAYFEVAQDSAAPFIVCVANMELEVVGTSFNVKAYEDENLITTTLMTGKIVQYYPDINKKIVLEPSKQSVYNRKLGTLATQVVDIQDVIAWKEAWIVIRNQRLDDILRGLSRWYDFEVVYENPELKDVRFHLHSKRFDNIQMILDVLQATNGIHVRYQGNRIYISK